MKTERLTTLTKSDYKIIKHILQIEISTFKTDLKSAIQHASAPINKGELQSYWNRRKNILISEITKLNKIIEKLK